MKQKIKDHYSKQILKKIHNQLIIYLQIKIKTKIHQQIYFLKIINLNKKIKLSKKKLLIIYLIIKEVYSQIKIIKMMIKKIN